MSRNKQMDFIHHHINTFSCTFPYKNRELVTLWKLPINVQLSTLLFSFVFIISLTTSVPTYASKKSILIITNKNIQRNAQISLNIKKNFLNKENISVEVYHYQNIIRKHIIDAHPSLIIALGSKASKLTFPSSAPTLHALIPENNLNKIDICTSNSCPTPTKHSSKSYTIYLDQPLFRQLNLLSLLLPSAKKIGVLTANFSQPKLGRLQLHAKKLNLSLITHHIENKSELNRHLTQLIRVVDVLFSLPDPIIHNRNNIPFLLLSTYRHNIPVLGFSKAYVNAGAFAAIYSSPEQITQHIIELAREIIYTPDSIPFSSFPAKYFSIVINERVVRSLELDFPNLGLIKSKLLLLEK